MKPEAAYQKTKTPYVERVAPGHLQDDLGRSVGFVPGDMRPLDIAKPSGAIITDDKVRTCDTTGLAREVDRAISELLARRRLSLLFVLTSLKECFVVHSQHDIVESQIWLYMSESCWDQVVAC